MKARLSIFVFLISCAVVQAQVVLSEICSKNNTLLLDAFGDTPDWIELQNLGSTSVNLQGYFLSDNGNNPQEWVFPNLTIPANGFLVLFAPGGDPPSALHTNFKLSSEGDPVLLSAPNGELLDFIAVPELHGDYSFAKQNGIWQIYDAPTPGAPNAGQGKDSYYAPPIFGVAQAFWDQNFTLSLSGEGTVLYTLNGRDPLVDGLVYDAPFQIETSTAVRAVVVGEDKHPSLIETATYFVEEHHDFPVISITVHPDSMFDPVVGLYEDGPNADPDWPFFGANYWNNRQLGCHVEVFENEEIVLNQDCAIRIHGGKSSRTQNMKPFRLIAKSEYGKDFFDHPLIKGKPNLKRYKKFVLRNSGSDFNHIHMADAFVSEQLQHPWINLDGNGSEECIVYINGEYYGFMRIREKIDEWFCKLNYGLADNDAITVLQKDFADFGTTDQFNEMMVWINATDFSDQNNYEEAQNRVDIPSLVDYIMGETFWNNTDWPRNNIRFWRSETGQPLWRFIPFDFDVSMNAVGYVKPETDNLNRFLNDFDEYDVAVVQMFQRFLENPDFKNLFANRYADLINTIYNPDVLLENFNTDVDYITPEMERHFARWEESNVGWWQFFWLDPRARIFVQDRPMYAFDYVEENLNYLGRFDLEVDNFPPDAGTFEINTIKPEGINFTGEYFINEPIRVKALPKAGYKFSHWQYTGEIDFDRNNPEVAAAFASATSLTAIYEPVEGTSELAVFPNPSDGDFTLQFYLSQPTTGSLLLFDQSGRLVQDLLVNATSGFNTISWPNQLANGVYIFELKLENTIQRTRVVVY